MTTHRSRPRPREFTPVRAFIDTAVARRMRAPVDRATRLGTNVIVLSLPGEGKTQFYLRMVSEQPVIKQDGKIRTSFLGCRRPHSGSEKNSLMYMLGARLGRILPMKPAEYLTSLVGIAQEAGVKSIVIDDAHELSRQQRAWLREFCDLLLDPARSGLAPAPVSLIYLANGLPRGRQTTPLFGHGPMGRSRDGNLRVDLDWVQFERRLHGTKPVAWIDGLDLEEAGEALNGLTEIYRPQFPELDLAAFTDDIHAGLLHPLVDYAGTGRVRMDSITKVVIAALDEEATAGAWGASSTIGPRLATAVELLKYRPELFENPALFAIDDAA
jgi:hypothetical protein